MERVLCPVTIGRSAEAARLTAALEEARAGRGQVVIAAADAGLGKTRLAADVTAVAAGLGMATLWGGCSEAEFALPYLPFLEAIGNHLGQADLDAIQRHLEGSHGDLGLLFPQLGQGEAPPDPNDPSHGRLRLYESILDLLRFFAAASGLLLVVENVTWADAATRGLLDYVVRRLRGSPILLLVTSRFDRLSRRDPVHVLLEGWRRSRLADFIELAPLGAGDVAQMLAAIFESDAIPREVSAMLHDRCEGNPYALEEILKDGLDRGALQRGAWSVEALAGQRLPRSVRESVLDRLEGLPEAAAEVLRRASVLGRSFDYTLLVAITGLEPAAVRDALRECLALQLIEDDPHHPGLFRFRHALTREAVYEDLLAPQREELHASAADALRQRPDTPPIELCQHLLAARREREAVPIAIAAAEQATRAHAHRQAALLYERVLPLTQDRQERARLLCLTGRALLFQGNAARAERHLREGVRELERAGDLRQAASHRIWLGRCYRERSRPDLARAEFEAARDQLELDGPSEDLALAYANLARQAVFQLDGQAAVDLARRAISVAGQAGADAPRIEGYAYLGLGHVQIGEVGDGLRHLDLAYGEALDGGYELLAAGALHNAILVAVQLYRPLEATERLRALKAMDAGEMVRMLALRAEGFTELWGFGRPVRARAVYEEAMQLALQGEMRGYVTWLEIQLAVALDELGSLDEAAALLERGVVQEGQDRATALYARIRIALDRGRAAEALQAAEEVSANDWPLRTLLY
ncbi:MAG: tetratricopeptide repeat protein, partial [Candidatus Dormibacteraeota bacterium]|nr:tetratricopeptide repeat protein [Candidatus Dormibacteraeota bacterium]